jgi:hypothetical protein
MSDNIPAEDYMEVRRAVGCCLGGSGCTCLTYPKMRVRPQGSGSPARSDGENSSDIPGNESFPVLVFSTVGFCYESKNPIFSFIEACISAELCSIVDG